MKNSAILLIFVFAGLLNAQPTHEVYFGDSHFDAPSASILNDKVYFYANAHDKKENGYFFKTDLKGNKDSVSVADLGEPFVYGFLYAGTYNNQLLWLGSYDSVGTGFYNVLGPAILLTDTNFNVIDQFVQHKPRWQVTALSIHGNQLIVSFDSVFTFSRTQVSVFDLSQNNLRQILDTSFSMMGLNIKSILSWDNKAYFFQGHTFFNTLSLSNFIIQTQIPSFDSTFINSKYLQYNSVKKIKPDSIIKANAVGHWFSFHRENMSLIDTFSIHSRPPILFFNNCDAVVDGHYYFGGSYPPFNVINGPAIETPFKICKLSGMQIAWERIIQEDSVYKELRYLMGTSAQDQLVALYINYDMRVAQPKLSIALTIMDTSGSVLSTQTLWEAPKSAISLYPNPAGAWFVIETDSRHPVDLTIHHANGQLVKTQQQVQPGTRVPITDLAKGTYMVSIALHGSAEPPVVRRLVVR
jgi:hypothetical protein